MDNITLVVSSTDSYSDLWDPFFKLLKKYWDPQCPILLSTDAKAYSYPGLDIRTNRFFKEGDSPVWSARLMKNLESVDTDYILFLLDDFFLQGPVDEETILRCKGYMDADPAITAFCFQPAFFDTNLDCPYEGFKQRPDDGPYRLNCQAALWRKSSLLKDMRAHESPWQFEILGSKRSRRYKDQKFYMSDRGVKPIPYKMPGGALIQGKWEEYVVELNEKEDLGIDFSVRGINTENHGSKNRMREYYFGNFSLKRIVKAIDVRWRSLKP